MNIEEINEAWAQDSPIDRNNLTVETLRSPNLHQKYLGFLMQAKSKLIKLENDLAELRILKFRYYRGELTKEELDAHGWNQYQGLKPLKSDMNEFLESDADILKIKLRAKYIENMIYQLESIMKQISGRDWAIRNHIEHMKFVAGA